MSSHIELMALAALLAAVPSFAETPAATAPQAGVAAVLATSVQPSAPAVYPKPPRAMSANATMFLEYYSRLWAKADYVKMYGALSDGAQTGCPFRRFAASLAEERGINGGVKGFSDVRELKADGLQSQWSLTINYVRSTAAPKTIRTVLLHGDDGWEVHDGGLLPLDNADFDR